jgi:transcriptional regulator with XRE-family HTH domain
MPRPNNVRDHYQDRLIGRLIREKRMRAGESQEGLGRLIGRPQPYISRVESGQHHLDIVELLQLADALGFDAGAFAKKAYQNIK